MIHVECIFGEHQTGVVAYQFQIGPVVRALTFQTSSEVTKRLHHINLLFFR